MCPVPVLVLQRVMEKVANDTVPDGQCAPFESCCFGVFNSDNQWRQKLLNGPGSSPNLGELFVLLPHQWSWPVEPNMLVYSELWTFDMFVKVRFLSASD